MADLEGMISTRNEVAVSIGPGASRWTWPLVGASVLLVLFVWMFYDFLRSQVIRAVTQQADWGHTLIVPFICGYFIYLNRQKLLAQPFRPAWLGIVPMLMGVGVYMLATVGPQPLHHFNIEGAGVWLTLFGIVLLLCGWRAMTWLWFPLVYLLVFGQTISERFMNIVTYPMQDITARGAYFVLALGLDVERNGNTLFIYDNGEMKPLNIAQACSGMRMLMAFLALGVVMAYTGFQRSWQRIVLVIMAVPTAIFVNILRVCTLGLLSLIDVEFAAGDFHSFIGLVWLVPAFMIYLGLMWVIGQLVVEAPHSEARTA